MQTLNLFFIGDIVGDPGLRAVMKLLPEFKQERDIHFCIANAENSHEGRGVNEHIVKKLYRSGVDVITGGDHSFDKHLIFPYMAKDKKLLRPMNYPKGAPGFGYGIYDCEAVNASVGVLNVRGQSFFNNPIRCPFRTAEKAVEDIRRHTQVIFVDFHAEATAEKIGMGWFLDGKVSAICGTHTHVQTGDEQILPQGAGYLTDAGFTGPHNSVIGMDKDTALRRFLLQTPQKYKMGEGDIRLNGVIFSIDLAIDKDLKYGRATKVERVTLKLEEETAAEPETAATEAK